MSNKSYAIVRTTYLNGNVIEVDRLFGFAKSKDEADAKTEALYESVEKVTALRGLSFVFHSKEVLSDAT
jgi:hypothetical protein